MPVKGTGVQPKDALSYLKRKKVVSEKELASLERNARDRAFYISGVTKQALAEEILASMVQAMEQGTSLQQWQRDIRETAKKAGLNKHRLETIYRTNTASAYMAGRYAQLQKATDLRPYWRYLAVGDKRTRPEHMALDGLVYPHDHEFWSQFFPPNGFNCRCTVQSLSERQVKARGYEVQSELPGSTEITDSTTGEVRKLFPAPDPGFGRNVGQDWLAGLETEATTAATRPVNDKALCKDGKGLFAGSCRIPLDQIDERHVFTLKDADLLPKTMPKEEQILIFLKEFGLSGLDDSKVVRLPGNFPLVVNKWLFLEKSTGAIKKTWADKGPYMRLLAQTIFHPFEVWWQPVELLVGEKRVASPLGTIAEADAKRPEHWRKRYYMRLNLVRLFRRESGKPIGGFSSFSLLGGKWHGATVYAPKADRSGKAVLEYTDKERGGVLIYRETLT